MIQIHLPGKSSFGILVSFGIALAILALASHELFAAELSIDDFLQEAHIRDAELSPDGKHLALIIQETDRRMVVVRNVEQPDMPIVGAFAEETLKPSWLTWGNNDRLLVSIWIPWQLFMRKQLQSNMNNPDTTAGFSRMVAMNIDMSEQTILMNGDRALKNNFSLSGVTNFLRNNNDHILMEAYRGGKRTLFKVNIQDGETELITQGSSRTFRFLSDDNGKPLYRFDYWERKNIIEFFAFKDVDDWQQVGKVQLNRDEQDRFDSSDLVSVMDNDLVYRKQNKQSGFFELVRINHNTNEARVLASQEGQDIYGALFNPRSGQLTGYKLEKDNVRSVYFDKLAQQQYDAIAASVGNNNFNVSSLDPDLGRALVSVSGPDTPTLYYLWNFESQALTYLGNAYPKLLPEELSKPALTSYIARDGTPLRAYILLPKGFEKGKQYPTIILPHGGPQSRDRADFDLLAQFISTRGYIVVQPNFRGSVGYGREFEEAGYRQYGGLMQDDLTDATRFMIEKGYSDPDRICIVGGSYGGYAALMGAIKTPELYTCAISMNGVTDLLEQIKYDKKEVVDKADWDDLLYRRVGDPKDDKAILETNSPLLNADKITIPILLIAGTKDERVPFEQSKQMAKVLEKAGMEHQFIEVQDAPHALYSELSDRKIVFEAIESFLATHLR